MIVPESRSESRFAQCSTPTSNTLEAENIEAQPLWKPMHMQPVFRDCEVIAGALAETLFRDGLCLPSGTAMNEADLVRVVDVIKQTHRQN